MTTRDSPEAVKEAMDALLTEVYSHMTDSSLVHLWRGQGNAAWAPWPTLYRRLLRRYTPDQVTEDLVRRYETDLLCDANGRGYYLSDRVSTLVSLQHHGGATRLLDVSRTPEVALWFASDHAQEEHDGRLFHIGIPSDRVYEHLGLTSWDDLIGKSPDTIAYFPRLIDERIKAQQAGFILTSLKQALSETRPFTNGYDGLHVSAVTVPNWLKGHVRQYLRDKRGIYAGSMYPDFSGFSIANSSQAPFDRDEQSLYDGADGLFPNRR